jgi:hypothetical protein
VSGASEDMNITFVSSNPDICIFSFNNYVVFAKLLIKIVHFYIIQLHVPNFCVELIPRAIENGYRNMQIVIFETECLIVACL